MADIIQLLPESIANQIAAGEVIQRPASVVKELLENAIDAGSQNITLILKDSGKTLIQVVDDGTGMSETDARMSLERHATSKIKAAKELFSITTMGFRGEALPSIASIAHLHIKTRKADEELGTEIIVHGSIIKSQEYCQTPQGTTITVKNLFFNVPARRKFLKSDSTELHHILEEFKHVSIVRPEIRFQLIHNDNELYHLPKGNLRQRLVGVFGKSINENLVPIEEETDFVKISGYIAKPDYAKKTRGDQFLFVNKRFIKSAYLNHAIKNGYDNLLGEDEFPFYALDLTLNPAKIDINIHPTKQEIKFEDERLIYNIMRVAIKHALAKYSISPSLDFDKDLSFDQVYSDTGSSRESSTPNFSAANRIERPGKKEVAAWNDLYNSAQVTSQDDADQMTLPSHASLLIDDEEPNTTIDRIPYQIHQSYIISQIKSGFILIDQQNAHERIMYERFLKALEGNPIGVQRLLFPITIEVTPEKSVVLDALCQHLECIGIKIEPFGGGTFIIHGITPGLESEDFNEVLDRIIEQYNDNLNLDIGLNESLALSMATNASIKRGKRLDQEEIQHLLDDLFATANPFTSPTGKKCYITFELNDLEKQF